MTTTDHASAAHAPASAANAPATAPPVAAAPRYADPQARTVRVSVPTLQAMAREGRRIAMLTCYDASFAARCDEAGVDVLLVGDSLGNVIQGHASTLPVTLADVVYHTGCVARGSTRALVIADLPFGSYQASRETAYAASVAALQAGAQMVKLEGGAWLAPTIAFLVERSIPVCGHIGLTPQSVHAFGGYRVQGKTEPAAEALVADARAIGAAGCALIVVECVPRALTPRLSAAANVPLIGIGAGPECAGQVLVLYDALGITSGKPARFVKNFMAGTASIEEALAAYVAAVREGSFPAPEHCF